MISVAQSRRTVADADISWHSQGACEVADSEHDVFYHPPGSRDQPKRQREAAAKAICATCPLAQRCRDQARTNRELYGVWGGETETERTTWLRKQQRARKAVAA